MSFVTNLPTSAFRPFKAGTKFQGGNIGEAGQYGASTDTWRVPIQDRVAFLNQVYGQPELIGATLAGPVTRIVPLRHPEFPWLLATSVEGQSVGWGPKLDPVRGTGFWAYQDFAVNFKSRPYPLDGQNAFLTIARNRSSRELPGPSSGFQFPDLTRPVYDPGRNVSGRTITVSVHQLSNYNTALYDSLTDCVNQYIFLDYPIGTVRYMGDDDSYTMNSTGVITSEVTHYFEYSKLPWNLAMKVDGSFDVMQLNGALMYPLADLTTLFA